MIGPLATPQAEEAVSSRLSAEDEASRRDGWRSRLRGVSRKRLVLGAGLVLLVIAAVVGGRHLDLEGFHDWAKRLPASGVAGVVAVLPLVGFPVSALHLAAGLRFEFLTAMGVVAAATLSQHALAWGLAHVLPERVFSRFEPWRKKLAGAGHREAAVLCSLVPGMPYTVQLYLLPVMGAPLRVLCLVSVPLHTLRATVTILLGNLSDDLTPGRIVALTAYYLTIFTICGFALRRLRRSLTAAGAGAVVGEPGAAR